MNELSRKQQKIDKAQAKARTRRVRVLWHKIMNKLHRRNVSERKKQVCPAPKLWYV